MLFSSPKLVKGVSILSVKKNNSYFHGLCFGNVFIFSISALVFIISFLLRLLGIVCSSFSRSLSCKGRLRSLLIYLFMTALGLHRCMWGFSSCGEPGAYSSLWCMGFSLQWLLLLQSMGSRHVASEVVVHGLSCPMACGIFLDRLNHCLLHRQADSLPLDHQGSPSSFLM